MDRHDRPSPGRYNESSPQPRHEYLSTEHSSPSGSGRRTLVISAAAAVIAAAVTAGGVITLTGRTTDTATTGALPQQESGQNADPGPAGGGEAAATDPDDVSSKGDADSDTFTAPSGTKKSSGSGSSGSYGDAGDQGDTPAAQKAEPVSNAGNTGSTKAKKSTGTTGTETTESQAGGPGPDGPAGYVAPMPPQPNRWTGFGPDALPDFGPTAKPTPKPSPTSGSKPSTKPAPKPTKTVTSSPIASPTGNVSKVVAAENEVARLTSVARQAEGCGPLRIDESLRKASRGHSDDMAEKGFFDHTSVDGRSFADRIRATGYSASALAENIARGQATPAEVVKGWLNSPGHRANIMNCKLKAIGVGVHFGSGGPWWTQDFGSD